MNNTHRTNSTTTAKFRHGVERRQDETGIESPSLTVPTSDAIGSFFLDHDGLGIVRILANRMSGRY